MVSYIFEKGLGAVSPRIDFPGSDGRLFVNKIAIVEDDPSLRELIAYTMESSGFTAVLYETGEDFLTQYNAGDIPDLILLDIMLPGIDGTDVFRILKATEGFNSPVIFLTARSREMDKVSGLDLGADDYITKPFGVLELASRVKAVLRRTSKINENPENQTLRVGMLTLHPAAHEAFLDGEPMELTRKEFSLLKLLMENLGIVLTRTQILNEVWDIDADIATRTVDMHVKTLRKKLGDAADYIQTVRGVGYRFEVPDR